MSADQNRQSRVTESSTETNEPPQESSESRRERLRNFLKERARSDGGVAYVKARFVAEEVGLSPKEFGALVTQIRDEATGPTVEGWSYSGATTWRVAIDG